MKKEQEAESEYFWVSYEASGVCWPNDDVRDRIDIEVHPIPRVKVPEEFCPENGIY